MKKTPHHQIISFLSPETSYSMRIYKSMLWLSYWWDSCRWRLPAGCYLPDKTLPQGGDSSIAAMRWKPGQGLCPVCACCPCACCTDDSRLPGRRWRKSGPSCFLSRWESLPWGLSVRPASLLQSWTWSIGPGWMRAHSKVLSTRCSVVVILRLPVACSGLDR